MNGDSDGEGDEQYTAHVAIHLHKPSASDEHGARERAKEQSERERRSENRQRWGMVVQWLTFFTVLGALIVYGLQWNEMKESTEAARRALRSAQKSALAAQRSVLEARRANRIQLEARAPEVYVIDFVFDAASGVVSVALLNRGQTVARTVRHAVDLTINPTLATNDPCAPKPIGPPTGPEEAKRLRKDIETIIAMAPKTPEGQAEVERLNAQLQQLPVDGSMVDPVGEILPAATTKVETNLRMNLPAGFVVFFNGRYSYEDTQGSRYYGFYCVRHEDGRLTRIFPKSGSIVREADLGKRQQKGEAAQ